MAKLLHFFRPLHFLRISLAVLPLAALLTLTVLYSQNSLFLNDEWIVQKRMLKMGVFGADEYLLTRRPLARNVLDLGVYHGFQEVVLRQNFSPSQIKFKFEIPPKSYLDVTFNRSSNGFSGIRLSQHPSFPSVSYESEIDGKFLRQSPFRFPSLTAGWHDAEVSQSEQGLILRIDHGNPDLIIASQFESGQIGFRAGLNGAKIDHVVIKTTAGTLVSPSFQNTKKWAKIFWFNFGVLLALGIILISFWRSQSPEKILSLISGLISTTFCVTLFLLFDFYYYSSVIPEENGITRILFNNPESSHNPEVLRFMAFRRWYRISDGEVISSEGVKARGYPVEDRTWRGPIYCGPQKMECQSIEPTLQIHLRPSPRTPLYRMLFIGSSQTVGAGAQDLTKTFFALTHSFLRANLPPKIGIESINMAISGATPSLLLNELKQTFLIYQPDLLVINLSNNGEEEDLEFQSKIEDFIKYGQGLGAQVLLLQEANSSENEVSTRLTSRHAILKKLADRYKIQALPLHDFLNQPSLTESGSLWWDSVHMSSYGQRAVADWLAPKLLELLLTSPPKQHSTIDFKE
jgi:lysophospholipase L1-like esterase